MQPVWVTRAVSRSTTNPTLFVLTGYILPRPQHRHQEVPDRARYQRRSAPRRTSLSALLQYQAMAQGPFERHIADVYAEYQKRLLDTNTMDFDDLLVSRRSSCSEAVSGRARKLPAPVSSTSWSTSIKTPTRPKTRSLFCSRQAHRNVCVVGDDRPVLAAWNADLRLRIGTKAIEEIEVGDRVRSWRRR